MNKAITGLSALSLACLLAGSAMAADLFSANFDGTDNTTVATAGPSGGAVYKFGGGACGGFSNYDGRLDLTSDQGTTVAPTDKAARVASNTGLVYCDSWGSFYGLSVNNGGAGVTTASDPLDISSAVSAGTVEFDIKAGPGDGEASGDPGGVLVNGVTVRGLSIRLEDSAPNQQELYRFVIPTFNASGWTHVSVPVGPFFSGVGAQAGFRAPVVTDIRKVVFVEGDFGGDAIATYNVDFLVDNVRITTNTASSVDNWAMYE